MELFDGLAAVPPDFGPTAVTIGKFDGLHAGHRAVIRELRDAAAERGIAATVVTFDRHPLSLLSPENCPEALVSNPQKIVATAAVVVLAAYSVLWWEKQRLIGQGLRNASAGTLIDV